MNESDYLAELTMDGQALLLPQTEVRLLESVLDLHSDPARGEVWLQSEGQHIPVWSLDRELRPLPNLPTGRRFCALLGPEQQPFGLTLGGFRLVPRSGCRLLPLPPALRGADSPLLGLVILDDRILPVSDAARLARRLPWPAEATP